MKVEIIVNIKNTDGALATESTTIEVEVPEFEAYTGPDKFGVVFDEYERKVLKARNEAIARATEKYLHEMAKKNTVRSISNDGRNSCACDKNYTVDAELGRLSLDLFEIKRGSQKVFRAAKDILPETGSREHYKTPCFKELVVFFPCDETFHKSSKKINRVLWRDE